MSGSCSPLALRCWVCNRPHSIEIFRLADLHRADPKDAVDFDASPEGHALRFNAAGKLIGVTILNARWLLEHEGKITITIPERLEVEAAALGEALTAA